MASSNDPFNLLRFVQAQEQSYPSVVEELKAGRKTGHWIWYIFPQVRGLGSSPTSQAYAIDSLAEAKAYLAHPVLGARLRECTQLAVDVDGRTAEEIFHYPDHLKFRSCLTLFARAAADPGIFRTALERYFGGQPDRLTLEILDRLGGSSPSARVAST